MGEMKKKNAGALLRRGSRGDEVRELQGKLGRLGFDLREDGIFGEDTEKTVIELQTMFGYTVDGLVGDGTKSLIDAQIGYGWNAKSPDAAQRALESQGKGARK
jgi:N-acetylmuramoyl-L-alanine amidase